MPEEPKIQPRDKLLRDTFTPAETFLFGSLLLAAFGTFLLADPRSFWLLGGLIIVGTLSPVILRIHQQTHPFFVDFLWQKFWLLTAPAWLLVVQFTVGLAQRPIQSVEIDRAPFLALQPTNPWLPVTASPTSAWITVLAFCAAYLLAVNLFIIPKSRSYFERLLPWLCLTAVLVGVFGFFQKALGLDGPFFTEGTGRSDFFAFFPYDGHWAAFALLWSAACVGLTLLSTRYDDSNDFIHSIGPWYLTGATILGGSGFIIEAQRPAAILLLSLAVLYLLIAVHFLSASKDPHRSGIALGGGVLAIIAFAGGIFRIFQPGEYASSAASLRQAATNMFVDRPMFGWGFDSFPQVVPFYVDDILLGTRHDRAASDMLQYFAEIGIVGLFLPALLFTYLLIRYVIGRHDIRLTNHLLIGCLGVGALALVDSPFMSPAVFFSFFVIFFSALRWADLSRNKVDEVDARPTLVLHPSERNVPFFAGEYKDVEK